MRCYELQRFGLAGLAITERERPLPGRGEVLVRVRAVSLNYRDWLMVQGLYNPKQKLPLIPLSDGAGEVEVVGEGVTRFQKGDRVAGIFFQTWQGGSVTKEKLSSPLGGPLDGMLTEYRVLPETSLVRIPAHLSFEEAATLPCAGVTAWNAIVEQGRVQPGENVLVQGTGGVSLFALQFARMAGARVIVTSSSDEKLARARSLGAEETINYRTQPDWDKRALELTGGAGVDHIVEVGGAGTIGRALRAVRAGGTVSVIGVLGGNATETNLIPILMRNLRLQGVVVGSREVFENMNRAMSLHAMRPVIDTVFPFEEIPQAFERMSKGAHCGKICARIS